MTARTIENAIRWLLLAIVGWFLYKLGATDGERAHDRLERIVSRLETIAELATGVDPAPAHTRPPPQAPAR